MLICEFAWQSLRKDVEASLDHIDDELFANLVSRVSYLKMRREWYEQLLRRNVNRFRGGLVLKAHRPVYHSSLGLSVIQKKKIDDKLFANLDSRVSYLKMRREWYPPPRRARLATAH